MYLVSHQGFAGRYTFVGKAKDLLEDINATIANIISEEESESEEDDEEFYQSV